MKEKQDKRTTKKLKISIINVVYIFIIIALFSIIFYAYARYVSSIGGKADVDVARWYFNVTIDGKTLDSEEINFATTRNANDTDSVKRGTIAPGTYGEFEIVVDTGGTDVLETYNIVIKLIDCPTNLKFYINSQNEEESRQVLRKIRISTEESEEGISTIDELAISRDIPLGENGEHIESIYWEWPFETGSTENDIYVNNVEDSKWINKEKMIMKIEATGYQVLVFAGSDTTIQFGDTEFAFANPYNIAKQDVEKIYTLGTVYVPENAIFTSWDISKKQDGSIMAYAVDADNNGKHEIYLSQNGGVNFGTNFTRLFSGYTNVNYIDVSNVVTDDVISMYYVFDGCENLKEIYGLQNWNTSNVKTMQGMFRNCGTLISLDVSKFNTTNVTNMSSMFQDCNSIVSLDVGNFNTVNVTTMYYMFDGCSSVESLDVSKFNTANVINMYGMFGDCSSLTSLDVSIFDTTKVINMQSMFYGCSSLTYLDVSKFNTSNVTNMYAMFYDCRSITDLNLSNFNTSNVTTMYAMFYYCRSLKSLYISDFDTANVKTMAYMFYGCRLLTSLDISKFDITNVITMSDMFYGCNSLTSIGVNKDEWFSNIPSTTDTTGIFSGCNLLQ